jgi:branched-chain amino acid transport system ATP-binding protein
MTRSSSPSPALSLQGVGRLFGALAALRDVTFDVARGERRAILGPNGAGKTTLFNAVCGDVLPTSGTIRLFGEDVTRLAAHGRARRGIGRTYQTSLLFNGLTVLDNLYVAVRGARPNRFSFRAPGPRDPSRLKARDLAERVRLTPMLERPVSELSHGQRRQLEVGMALACDPRLLMLDEPAAGLSAAERPELNRLLASLPRDLTLILIEHDMDVALPNADIVTVMKDGAVVVENTPDRIQDDPLVYEIYLGRKVA